MYLDLSSTKLVSKYLGHAFGLETFTETIH